MVGGELGVMKRKTSNIEHRTLNIEHRTSNVERGKDGASRGGFTRQAVNLACFEALAKILPVRLPVRRRQVTRQEFVRRSFGGAQSMTEPRLK